MDKAIEIGKTSATGSIHLFLGKTLSTIIMAVGTIVMGLIILQSDYGLYTIALIPATTMLLFADWGVGSATIRRCAQCRASGNESQLRKVLISGLTFELATGLILTLLSLLLAGYFASSIFGQPSSSFLLAFASINILATSISGITGSILVGFERMKLVSLTFVCQAIGQGVVGPLLVYFGFGAFGALAGFTVASVATSLLSLILVYFLIFRKLEKVQFSRSDLIENLKSLLKYGIPLAIAGIVAGLLTQFNSIMMVRYVKDLALIGNYKVALNFVILLSFFSAPIITVLFPAFSKLNPQGEPQLVNSVFASSVKYAALIMVPATMALIVLSNPIIGALYGGKWPFAPLFLILSAVGSLFVIFGSLSVANFLSALGHTRLVLLLNVVGLAVGIPLAFVFIPSMGIIGMLISSVISGVPSLFLGLYFIMKKYGAKIDFLASAKILFSSTFAAIIVYGLILFYHGSFWLELAAGFVIFLAVFLVSAPLVGAVTRDDLNNLRSMVESSGVFSKLMEIPLTIMERILIRLSNKKELQAEP